MARHSVDDILHDLQHSDVPLRDQLERCRQPGFDSLWKSDARMHRAFGKKLISADHPSRAYEIIREGLEEHPNDSQLLYLRALALARSGNVSRALRFVDDLLDRRINRPLRVETLSLKGRLFKDCFRRTANPELKAEHARQSAAFYARALKLTADSFPAINAATMSLLCGRDQAANELARMVVEQVEAERLQPGREGDYWLAATLGEAHLLLGEIESARRYYGEAVELAAGNDGDIAAMRLQLRLLEPVLSDARDINEALFDLGGIVVFAGHMIDRPDRSPPRFPDRPALIDAVRHEIAERLRRINARIGYSSVACGADILFCEELLKRKGSSLQVILPFRLDDFYGSSVDFGLEGMSAWRRRCKRILSRADEVHYATQGPFLNDDMLFEYGTTFSQGLAVLRADRIGAEPTALCVLDPVSRGTVGTAAFHSRWKRSGHQIDVIDLAALRPQCGASEARGGGKRPTDQPRRRIRRKLHAMLFADVKNYSKLTDEQAPDFVVTFINQVSRIVKEGPVQPKFQNTWGDGLFFVFGGGRCVLHCAHLALTLLERIEAIDWSKLGMPGDTTIRIAVHAGPVYKRMDQIIERPNFFGDHVNRTARIEPVTTPGCVFASEQFAAQLAVRTDHDFVTEFVGVEELAKGYDRCALYQLGRRC